MKSAVPLFLLAGVLTSSCTSIYWTDHKKPSRINRLSLDAKRASVVIEEGAQGKWPRSPFTLAYYRKKNLLVWQDRLGHTLKAVDRSSGKLDPWEISLGQSAVPRDLCIGQETGTVFFVTEHLGASPGYNIQAVSIGGSEMRQVTPKRPQVIRTVDIHPSGKVLIYTVSEDKNSPFEVWSVALDSGDRKRLLAAQPDAEGSIRAALDPSGRKLFWTRNALWQNEKDGIWAMPLDGSTGPEQLVAQGRAYPHELEIHRSWRDGIRIYWTDGNRGTIETAKIDGSDHRVIVHVRGAQLGYFPTALELIR